jgi:hypothetical protein
MFGLLIKHGSGCRGCSKEKIKEKFVDRVHVLAVAYTKNDFVVARNVFCHTT